MPIGAIPSEGKGQRFESSWVRHNFPSNSATLAHPVSAGGEAARAEHCAKTPELSVNLRTDPVQEESTVTNNQASVLAIVIGGLSICISLYTIFS